MDRNKQSQAKVRPATKAKVHPPPGDLFALGKQGRSTSSTDIDAPKINPPGAKKLPPLAERKRDAPAPAVTGLASKKPKLLSQGQTFTPLGRPSESERRVSPATVLAPQFEESAIEVEPAELLDSILEAEDDGNDVRVEGLLCGAVKNLRASRSKPDTSVYLTLMYLAKFKPAIFGSEIIIEAFCSLLKRDMSLNFKAKGNPLVSVLASNVLMSAFAEEENWPDDFVKVYVEDSLGERVWVDRPDCKGFVDNVLTAFNTNIPSKANSVASSSDIPKGEQSGSSSPSVSMFEEEENNKIVDADSEKSSLLVKELENILVFPRFPYQQDIIETYVLDIIKEHLNRRQPMDSRNLIRLLTVTCGYGEVRLMVAQRLEMWLQNPKLARPSQDLLMSICMNCNKHDQSDREVMAQLIKIRIKTKPLLNHYLSCIRELIVQHSENLRVILINTVYNELSNARNPNNMAIIGATLQTSSEAAARVVAEIFQDLLTNKDDYLRALRALFREIVRSVRYEINFAVFCQGLMQERDEPKFTELESNFKERLVLCITDLLTLAVLLGISPSVREAVAGATRGESKDIETMNNFRQHVSMIQRDSVWWLHTAVPKFIELKPAEYVHCIRKILFMEAADHYHNKDNWPTESERGLMLQLVSESPVHEDTLMRILVIGLSRELPLSPGDAVEMADQLIKRAASLCSDGQTVLQVERLELVDVLLNLCAYRHPENITLPKGYKPPTLAISNLYWKGWIMLLIISAFNPASFGLTAWENYATLKCMMEMVMTRNYKFPPPTTAVDDKIIEEIRNRERQIAHEEKQSILEFESHLAAATSKVTITESNSLLIAQLTSMDPNGIARHPPTKVLDELKILNDSLKIGQMLCRSRNPDFLLDVIQRQGTTQSMPWLAELVESSEGSLEVLPVQCLCEFLLHEPHESTKDVSDDDLSVGRTKFKQKLKKQRQLQARLQQLVHSETIDSRTTFEVLDYFLKRLSSTVAVNRAQAIKGLSIVLAEPVTEEKVDSDTPIDHSHKWLLDSLPALPMFPDVKHQTCLALREACQVETDPALVSAFLIFLSQHTVDQDLQELDALALDVAQLIMERTTVLNHILPQDNQPKTDVQNAALHALINLYSNYLRKSKDLDTEAYSWSNTQDQIILQWKTGESATMRIVVVHAMVILLTYGAPEGENHYQEVLDTWFPENSSPPSAFLLDTSEEALLLPDWLKLRMIRSSVNQIVNAALQDLEAGQLLLFVQSFGIPVSSMAKLLNCLDETVTLDREALEQAVMDKAYMAQFIEIQHMRGAEGGNKFYKMLTEHLPKPETDNDIEMKPEKKISEIWTEEIINRQPTIPQTVLGLADLLLRVFGPAQKPLDRSLEKDYQILMKSCSTSESSAATTVSAIHNILTADKGEVFCTRLFQSSKSCSLFRILLSKISESTNLKNLQRLIEKLSTISGGQKSPLSGIIHQFLLTQNRQSCQRSRSKANVDIMVEKLKVANKLDENKFLDEMKLLSAKQDGCLELLIQRCMNDSVSTGSSVGETRAACRALIETETEPRMLKSTASLFIDWLELIDPEVIQSAPDLQRYLLFAKKHMDRKSSQRSSQPYLLSLLTHQSNWQTVCRSISCLLAEHDPIFDPTSVLDFLWACIHIPRIWQGRDHKITKNYTPEDVLGLNADQLIALVDYIVEEASLASNQPYESHDQRIANESAVCIGCRTELLTCCVCEDDGRLKAVVEHIEKIILDKSTHFHLYHHLLLELYLQRPYLLTWLRESNLLLTEGHSGQRSLGQLDMITHRLLSVLGQAGQGSLSENRMYDANIALRKLASKHPLLFLRQLPMVAALLKGKTDFTFGEMKHKNYHLMFTHILGLLELLQPYIFRKESTSLPEILEAYFTFIQKHGIQRRILSSLIVKFVTFLDNFVNYDAQRSVTLLKKHIDLLSYVSQMYPEMSRLKSLLAGLNLPRQNQNDMASIQGETSQPLAPSRPSSPWTVNQLLPYHRKLSMLDSEVILEVLQEMDEVSKRKVDLLEHFVTDMQRFMYDKNDRCRNTAYSLIMRLIRHSPGSGSDFVPTFLQCLGNEHPDVVTTALKNLAEFCVLCQDQVGVILQKAFSVGVNTMAETSTYISETLQLLNLNTAASV